MSYDDWKLTSDRDDDWWNEPEGAPAMTKITLETADGDYVTSAEIEDEPPELIVWNGRHFLSDQFEPRAGVGELTYTEVLPWELPYDPQQARPADDESEPEGQDPELFKGDEEK